MTLTQKILKSDITGASASGLCIIHCATTPILFLANLSVLPCCETIPLWWHLLNYLFLTVSFIAVMSAVKKSTKAWLGIAFIVSWTFLFLAILVETFKIVIIPEVFNYIPAFCLIALHLYNRNYCTCDDCC